MKNLLIVFTLGILLLTACTNSVSDYEEVGRETIYVINQDSILKIYKWGLSKEIVLKNSSITLDTLTLLSIPTEVIEQARKETGMHRYIGEVKNDVYEESGASAFAIIILLVVTLVLFMMLRLE